MIACYKFHIKIQDKFSGTDSASEATPSAATAPQSDPIKTVGTPVKVELLSCAENQIKSVHKLECKVYFLQVQHVVSSPPHIMDHCYARPAPTSTLSVDSGSDVEEGDDKRGQNFDHDYTTPRTPPAARAPLVQQQQLQQQQVKRKSKPIQPSRPALPFKPVKYKLRPPQGPDQFKINYKFLTEGVDEEDIMYLRRSYELVGSSFLIHHVPGLTQIHLIFSPATERRPESASIAVDQ